MPQPRLPSVGRPAAGPYTADTGFAGIACEARWADHFGVQVVAPPQPGADRAWSRAWRRWLAGRRQIVETVIGRPHATFRLDRERPHDLTGFQARLAGKIALHNVCCWLNRQRENPDLALADLLGW